jgi:hypothetical protein
MSFVRSALAWLETDPGLKIHFAANSRPMDKEPMATVILCPVC